MNTTLLRRISAMIFNKFLYRFNELWVFVDFIKDLFQFFHGWFFGFHGINDSKELFKLFAQKKVIKDAIH